MAQSPPNAMTLAWRGLKKRRKKKADAGTK